METEHRRYVGDSRGLSTVADDAVELVVTSPPYPMIEMWDDAFTELNPDVAPRLAEGDGDAAFELMHAELDRVWAELERVLVPGGIACINVGDATRKVDGSYKVYHNHSRILESFTDLGFHPLPEVLWRKPTNSANKFLGSGMLPPTAYVTLEHEFILVFRNGATQRAFEPGATRRYESAYFWEERNEWFSDVWTDITGEFQALDTGDLRDRSAAYPFEIPYRLVNMYSVYGDTVLDPFSGTGTTALAAMVAGRNSVGYEIEAAFSEVFDERVSSVATMADRVVETRLERHREFVDEELDADGDATYESEVYGFPVKTRQEERIQLYTVADVQETADGYRVHHEPVTHPAPEPEGP